MKTPFITSLLITFLISCHSSSFAQHELRFSAGVGSYPTINEQRHGMCDCDDHFRYEGTYNFEYYYQIDNSLKIGASYTFESQYHKVYSMMPGNENAWGSYRSTFHTFLLNTSKQWIHRKWVELYSSVGFGMSLGATDYLKETGINSDQPSTSKIKAAYQITPIGLRIGKQWGGFMELGFGYKGIIAAGLSFRL